MSTNNKILNNRTIFYALGREVLNRNEFVEKQRNISKNIEDFKRDEIRARTWGEEKSLNWTKKLIDDEKESIKDYTSRSAELNQYLLKFDEIHRKKNRWKRSFWRWRNR